METNSNSVAQPDFSYDASTLADEFCKENRASDEYYITEWFRKAMLIGYSKLEDKNEKAVKQITSLLETLK
jgi:hypothetical protein